MQELKNKDKVVQKMSRDGLTEQNLTTGEERRQPGTRGGLHQADCPGGTAAVL